MCLPANRSSRAEMTEKAVAASHDTAKGRKGKFDRPVIQELGRRTWDGRERVCLGEETRIRRVWWVRYEVEERNGAGAVKDGISARLTQALGVQP